MGSKRSRSSERETEQAAQQHAPTIKRAESTSVKLDNYNCNKPVIVFAHGAGASSASEWMVRWRNLLANALNAVEVVALDYPYIFGKRKAPPKEEKLVGFHMDMVRKVAAKYPEHPLILAGKSMGSRISCMVASENGINASAVVCLGYPLKGTNGVIRDGPLLQLTVPIMFVQGSNDVYCPLELLDMVRKKLKASNDLHVIQNGDHSFQIAKKNLELTGMTREEAEERAAGSVAMFVSRITGEKLDTGGLIPDEREIEAVEGENGVKTEESEEEEAKVAEECRRKVIRSRPKLIRRRRPSERIILKKLGTTTVEEDGEGSSCDKAIQLD